MSIVSPLNYATPGTEGTERMVRESGWDKRTNNGNSIRPVFEARKGNQPKGTYLPSASAHGMQKG